MKLYLNKTSPYARLVMVVAHEKVLTEALEYVWTDPWSSPAELLAVNPFAKVPALVTDDGQSIIESVCICDFLDAIGRGRRLLPVELPARFDVLRKYGIGRALIDTAFGVTIERRFASPGHPSVLVERWLAALHRAMELLARDETLLRAHDPPDLGDLAISVGLSYIEFRLPEVISRCSASHLAHWMENTAARPSMQLTQPA